MRTSRILSGFTRRSVGSIALATVAVVSLAACGGGSDPLSAGGEGSGDDPNTIIVGSANFPESETVANIYTEVLRANGFDVTTKFNIGSREAYIPALKDGSIDVIPDYTGNLLQYLDPDSTATSAADVDALASGQITAADIFTTSPAIAQNGFVVLADPQNNFAAQNVVPVVRATKSSDKLTRALDALSAKLTTEELVALNDSVSGEAKTEPAAAAKQWVTDQGLDKPVS